MIWKLKLILVGLLSAGLQLQAQNYAPSDSLNYLSEPAAVQETQAASSVQKFFKDRYNLEVSENDNHSLYQFVTQWHRAPYRWGGLTKRGVDCSGLVGAAAGEVFNVELTRGADHIYKQCQPVLKSELQEGDLVFFKIASSRISHVGMYLKNNKFVHATTCCGVIVSDLNEAYYKRWYYGSGRHENISSFSALQMARERAAQMEEARQLEACANDPETVYCNEIQRLQADIAQPERYLLQVAAQQAACAKEQATQKLTLSVKAQHLTE